MVGRLPYDILVQIMEALSDDYHSLYNCSLVDQDFNHAASRILYTRIEYSPQQQHVLNLRDRGTLSERPLLASACTPRNALFVQELEIKGFISTRPPPLFVLSTTIADAIRKFTNLSKVTLCPTTFHDSLFIETLKLLWKATHIRELTVNNSCMGNETTPLLTRVGGLTHLTLHSPGRAILDSLPNWLGRLSPQLVGLCLKDNCGSITPGVLRSFLPHVFINLHELTLGLSFSLADEDVFLFLAQLQHLERLELQYYLQLKEPKTRLNLTRLKYFAVKYVSPWTRPQMVALCKWIKRVISNSPIEHIRLICEEGYGGVSSVPFDSIISHLAKKHCTTLRALNFSHAYVGVKAVKTLFESCLQLEEVYIAGRESVLDTFQECVPQLRRLHTVGFNIRNAKTKMKKMLVDDELATKIISRGTPTLRRLFINGTKWEGLWVTRQDGSVHFVVSRARSQDISSHY